MGLLLSLAALVMHAGFWGFIALIAYLEGLPMAISVALPFVLFYRWVGRWCDGEEPHPSSDHSSDYSPSLNGFQQPLSNSPKRRQLPG